MDIGQPKRIIEVKPASLPVPTPVPSGPSEPASVPEPAPAEPGPSR
jgi:hypothetical protein